MKPFLKIITLSALLFLCGLSQTFAFGALDVSDGAKVGQTSNDKITFLSAFKNNNAFAGLFFDSPTTGEQGARNLLVQIAYDLKNLFIFVAGIYFMILVIRLFFTDADENSVKEWRRGILYTSTGIILMQSAYVMTDAIYNSDIITSPGYGAAEILNRVVMPFVNLMSVLASFTFLLIAFLSFFKVVGSGGSESTVQKSKERIMYAIAGFIIIKISSALVVSVYGNFSADCQNGLFTTSQCLLQAPNISNTIRIVTSVINYINGFVALIIVALLIYAGFLMLTAGGDGEKLKKVKTIVISIAIGLFILVASYAIYHLFVLQNVIK